MLRGEPSGTTHAARLNDFYAPQAEHYDRSRERMLHGRSELLQSLALRSGETLVELGAGTGRNLDWPAARVDELAAVWLIDLCPVLLARARERFAGSSQVHTCEADAALWQPPQPVDAVLCAYSLTMIPDWFAAIDNAWAMLRPGGRIGVVDFYVSRTHPPPGRARHCALARALWPAWFGHDGVRLSADHLPYLERRFAVEQLSEHAGALPWLPGLRVPYYRFVGRKPVSVR